MPALHHRSGIAMLIVLTALVISSTAIAIMASAATRHALTISARDDGAAAHDLIGACQAPVRSWLTTRSQSIVLPPDTERPAIEILQDRWVSAKTTFEIRITAWDQCGMVPVAAIINGHPIAPHVDKQFSSAVKELLSAWMRSPGLDQLPAELTAFPALLPSQSAGFERAPAVLDQGDPIGIDGIGGVLATHNPPEPVNSRRGRTTVLLNINTASIALLEDAMRLAGRGGIERITEARENGEMLTSADTRALVGSDSEDGHNIRFLNSSPSWAIRIDVRVGMARESVWEVWTRSTAGWKVVQRLAIDE